MPGIGFLFWNVGRRPLEQRVARIVASRGVDVVLLAEYEGTGADLVTALSAAGADDFHEAAWSGSRVRVFSRLPRRSLQQQYADPGGGWLVYRVVHRPLPEFFLVAAHLLSKVNVGSETQGLVARTLAADLAAVENQRAHSRTVVVGDLNMNPFESGVAGADALHAVSARAVAERQERVIQGRSYRMFYNPMWSFLGDRTPGPPGTYYRGAAEAVNYFWNTYDQVLVRPGLIDRMTDLVVLDTDGVESLLTRRGLPARRTVSDHLPLFFRLDW